MLRSVISVFLLSSYSRIEVPSKTTVRCALFSFLLSSVFLNFQLFFFLTSYLEVPSQFSKVKPVINV